MSNDLSKDPDEEHAWSRSQSDCIAYQQQHGFLTIEVTSQAMQTALDILESHTVRQRHRRKKRLSQRKIKTLVSELLRMETKKFGSQRTHPPMVKRNKRYQMGGLGPSTLSLSFSFSPSDHQE
jgi:hypothetical protein